jgi:hypothetical protein
MSAGIVNGARMLPRVAKKKCAAPMFELRERAVRRVPDGPSHN